MHGRDQPALRVLPAHQGLGRQPRLAVQRNLGLQVQAQFVVLHGPAQLGQQRQGLRARQIKAGVVSQRPAELALGRIHGNLGTAEQGVGIVGVVRPARNADTGAQIHTLVFKDQRLFERAVDAARHLVGCSGIGPLQQHGKLVAAHAGHHVLRCAHLLAQPARHRLQQPVAKGIAEHIVHMLEPVEVQRQHSQRLWHAHIGGGGGHHGCTKTLAVGQPREAIPKGQPPNLALLRADIDPHLVKRARQIADFIGAVGVLHRHVIFAAGQSPCGGQQRAQRGRHTLCHHAIAQGKQQHTGHRDDGQQHLQLAIGRNDLVHRAQQQRLHIAPDRVQRTGACQQDPLIGVELACGDALAAQHRQRGGGQGAHRHGQHAILAFHQQRHMHRQQLPHFVRQGLADGKPHQHPADHHRRAHGHHDKLVGHAPDHGHTAALRLAGQQRRHLPHSGLEIACAAGCA